MRRTSIMMLFLVTGLLVSLSSCGAQGTGPGTDQKWEYLIERVSGQTASSENEEFKTKRVNIDEDALNELGAEGWELVGTYEETETVYPNWGNEKYVTGIQPNVRTHGVVFIFKRPAIVKKGDKSKKGNF